MVPNGNDGAPPGRWRSEISTSISQESQQITQGRAQVLLQLPGVGCVEPTPSPEAMTCQEGPGGSHLPWAGGCGRCPLTAPGTAGKLVKHPQVVGVRGGRASRRQQNNPESLSGSGGPPSGMQIPGSTTAGQTLQEMTRNPPVHLCFPSDLGTPRAAKGLTDSDSGRVGANLRGAEVPTSATEGAWGPLRNTTKLAHGWVGAGDPAPLPGHRQKVLELRKCPGQPTSLSGIRAGRPPHPAP